MTYFSVLLILFVTRFAVEQREDDVGVRMSRFVRVLDSMKAGKIMMKRKFGTQFLSRYWLMATCCAEKTRATNYRKLTRVRLFKD